MDSLLKTPLANEPVYRQYELLRGSLGKYRKLEERGNWLPISNKKQLILGDTALRISQIKKRLFNLGDYKGDTLNLSFSSELSSAIKNFQERNGLNSDGLLNNVSSV